MAPIKLDRKSRLKFGLSNVITGGHASWHFLFVSFNKFGKHVDAVSVFCICLCLFVAMLTVWESVWTFLCWPVCDFNHPPTRQPEDPIAPHMPMPTRTRHQIPRDSNFFGRRNRMFLPKEKLLDTRLIRRIIPMFSTTAEFCFLDSSDGNGMWKPRCQRMIRLKISGTARLSQHVYRLQFK